MYVYFVQNVANRNALWGCYRCSPTCLVPLLVITYLLVVIIGVLKQLLRLLKSIFLGYG